MLRRGQETELTTEPPFFRSIFFALVTGHTYLNLELCNNHLNQYGFLLFCINYNNIYSSF